MREIIGSNSLRHIAYAAKLACGPYNDPAGESTWLAVEHGGLRLKHWHIGPDPSIPYDPAAPSSGAVASC